MNRRLTQPTNVDTLPQLAGLVRHDGYRDYSSLLEQELIKPGDLIVIPLVQGSQPVARSYKVLPDGRLDGGIFGKEKSNKLLQGAYWYFRQ